MTSRLQPDNQWFRSPDGTSLIAGSPLSFFKVSQKGADILTLIENNDLLPEGHEQLTDRLIAAGAAHPLLHTSVNAEDLTVVIPTYLRDENDGQRLANLVQTLKNLRVIVVDDCSSQQCDIVDATVIRLNTNSGPGVARNTGLIHVRTPYVAFVDDDVSVTTDTLLRLAAHMSNPHVAVVAPRIISSNNGSLTGEYDTHHSPLDLGAHPTLIKPLSRVSYVPAAILVCRTDAIRSVNGFAEDMRMGEDVDFIWRMSNTGHMCRYEPSLSGTHETRRTVRELMKQRFNYGTSAARLAQCHGKDVSPLRVNVVLLLPSLALLLGYLWMFLPLLGLSYLWHLVTLRKIGLSTAQRLRITTIGLTSTVRLLARAIARTWWPIFLAAAVFWWPARFALLASLLIPAAFATVQHRPRRPFRYLGLHILDDMSYGLGVWWGALRQRSFRCLVPTITRSPFRLRSKR